MNNSARSEKSLLEKQLSSCYQRIAALKAQQHVLLQEIALYEQRIAAISQKQQSDDDTEESQLPQTPCPSDSPKLKKLR